ncbi:hypothetical protein WR25_20889 [Diploscapter pachys]|uniref:K Homology domain-containing protein n=1 Tax=Diploscapter pachys TaxID=2018661 RepID=A0A2A2KT29_9BILA|nr:hypothetical protein WR25_20889 [Diploscapter pachys]
MDSGFIELDDTHVNGESTHLNGHGHGGISNGAGGLPAPIPRENVVLMDYSTDFPKLPDSAPQVVPAVTAKKPAAAWPRPVIAPSTVTQTLTLAADERANRVKSIGNSSEEARKCQQIAQQMGTKIELSESKDGALTVVIKGPRAKVEETKAKAVRELQTQASRDVEIPKEYHGKLIGKGGELLRQLENECNCRINVPNRDNASHAIHITGPREGIEKATARIRAIAEKEASLSVSSIHCPRLYYPWVRGPYNENVDRLTKEFDIKINIPPTSAQNEFIIISGEREGVHRASAEIKSIIASNVPTAKRMAMNLPRTQHRFVIGHQRSGLHEILKQTGIIVEMPSEDSNSEEVVLHGNFSNFTRATEMVVNRAFSTVAQQIPAPNWLHRFIIGPKGATLQNLVGKRENCKIDFLDSNQIHLEGNPAEVQAAADILKKEVDRLAREMQVEKVKVHPAFHRHVIGRGGSLISKIKDETGVQITIPNENTNSDEIVVEGKKDGVARAVAEIKQIVAKIENEKSKDIIIPQRLHKLIIGTKGAEINKLREAFPNVTLTLPDANKNSDVVNIRGNKTEVDTVFAKLTKLTKELQESNYQQTVPIFKEFVKHIVGKGGNNLKKIRDETQTRIDVSESETVQGNITVTGKKENVEKAVEMLKKIEEELASIVTKELDIPCKVQARLHGGNRRLIGDIEEECGGVHIKFPSEKSQSTKVTVRGPAADVEKAVNYLTALAQDKEIDIYEDTVVAQANYHKFLIGKGGSRVKKYKEQNDVRVMFPRQDDTDKETIHLLGKKDEVLKVKKELEDSIKQLNETIETKIEVDPKYYKHFLQRGAALINEIQEQNGGVQISFPAKDSGNTSVSIKGSKQCVESARARIEEVVGDIDSQVTISVEIAQQHHRAIVSNRCQKIHDIQSKYDVHIRLPERLREGEAPTEKSTIFQISGRDTKCEAAKEALLALIPISKPILVPADMHRSLIGKGGEIIRKLMQDFDVNINVPKNGESEEIIVTGSAEDVDATLVEIQDRIEKYNLEADDRKARSYQLVIEVPAEFHQKIIGPRGANINQLRDKHGVRINIPKGDERSNSITIVGYEEKTRDCAAEIESMLEEQKSMFTQEVFLDARYHPRLIGRNAKNLKTVQDKYHVEIRISRDPAEPNLVTVAGKDEDTVYDCVDYLKEDEEAFLEQLAERGQYISPRQQEAEHAASKRHAAPVQFNNAPWQHNEQDFPQMAASATPQQPAMSSGAWGRR